MFDDFCNRINPRARTGEPLVSDAGPNHRSSQPFGSTRNCSLGCDNTTGEGRGHTNDADHSDRRSEEPRANRIGTIEQKHDGGIDAIARANPWTPTCPTRECFLSRDHPSPDRRSPLKEPKCIQGELACVVSPGDGRRHAPSSHEGATRRAFREKSTTRRDPKHFWLEGVRAMPDDELPTGC